MKLNYDVIIIGSGPSGIAAATSLKAQGVSDILILEREAEIGGVPRHCQHPTFGILAFKRPMKGSKFVEKLQYLSADIPKMTNATVVALHEGGRLTVSCQQGLVEMQAKRVIIATGARETPRHPRLVSGLRPQGVLTTGALQQFIYLNQQKPCLNPVVIGSEIVSFSALWTLRNAGIRTRAMIESQDRITANRPFKFVAGLMGVPLHLNTKLVEIGGLDRVEYVLVESDGKVEKIECDAVIFTGQFTGECALIRKSHLNFIPDTGCPIVDDQGRCSDPAYYAVGNMLHPADMGDQCYLEGKAMAFAVAKDLLSSQQAMSDRVSIKHDDNVLFTVPACLERTVMDSVIDLNIRVKQAVSGQVTVKAGDVILYQGRHRCLPGRRIMLKKVKANMLPPGATEITVSIV